MSPAGPADEKPATDVCEHLKSLRAHTPLSPSKSNLSRHAHASTHLEDELPPEIARLDHIVHSHVHVPVPVPVLSRVLLPDHVFLHTLIIFFSIAYLVYVAFVLLGIWAATRWARHMS